MRARFDDYIDVLEAGGWAFIPSRSGDWYGKGSCPPSSSQTNGSFSRRIFSSLLRLIAPRAVGSRQLWQGCHPASCSATKARAKIAWICPLTPYCAALSGASRCGCWLSSRSARGGSRSRLLAWTPTGTQVKFSVPMNWPRYRSEKAQPAASLAMAQPLFCHWSGAHPLRHLGTGDAAADRGEGGGLWARV